jgi:hypothetical protein
MTTTKPTRTDRASSTLLVLIVLAVGVMAGAASFRHVHDWTMDNSPTNTPGWFGWANAVITELIPTAALIIIAKRRGKPGSHITYPMFLLISAVSLSLTAQLAVAERTVFGWMVSALPSLAFFALSKLVFSATKGTTAPAPVPASALAEVERLLAQLTARITELETRPTNQVPALTPATIAQASSTDTAPATARPVADHDPGHANPQSARNEPNETTPTPAVPAVRRDTEPGQPAAPRPAAANPGPDLADLFPSARLFAETHQKAHGTPITHLQLAVRMGIDSRKAKTILDQLTEVGQPTTQPHNGTPIGARG